MGLPFSLCPLREGEAKTSDQQRENLSVWWNRIHFLSDSLFAGLPFAFFLLVTNAFLILEARFKHHLLLEAFLIPMIKLCNSLLYLSTRLMGFYDLLVSLHREQRHPSLYPRAHASIHWPQLPQPPSMCSLPSCSGLLLKSHFLSLKFLTPSCPYPSSLVSSSP